MPAYTELILHLTDLGAAAAKIDDEGAAHIHVVELADVAVVVFLLSIQYLLFHAQFAFESGEGFRQRRPFPADPTQRRLIDVTSATAGHAQLAQMLHRRSTVR